MKVILISVCVSLAAACPSVILSPQEAQARFQELDRKAQIEFRRSQLAEASEDFHQAGCMAPESMRSYYELYEIAATAAAAGNFPRARQALEEADRLRPDYELPAAMLVKVNLLSGDIDSLKVALLAAAHRFPRNGRLHADLAQDLLHEKNHDLALAEALRAVESGAPATTAMNLAVLENQIGAFGDAALVASAIEQQTGLPVRVRASAAGIAGLSFEKLEQFPDAARHLETAVQLDPSQEQPYLALARVYTARQDNPRAIEILQQARKLAGGSPNVLLALGSALVSAEQYQAAREILAGLIASFPEQLEAYPKLAEAYRNLGEPGRATETLRQLARQKRDDPMLHVVIARSLLDEEKVDYPLVLQELATAEHSSPDDYDIHYLRGRVFLATGEYGHAVESLQHAIELRPLEPGAYYQLGLTYGKLGQPQLAKEQFDRLEFLKGPPAPLKARD